VRLPLVVRAIVFLLSQVTAAPTKRAHQVPVSIAELTHLGLCNRPLRQQHLIIKFNVLLGLYR
jgi:hypothetical protein